MKYTISLLFGLFAALILTIAASAVSANLPTFDVTLNGVKVENENREYPLIVYKDITYFPMTYFDCRFLGISTDWDDNTKTLDIAKENIACAYRDHLFGGITADTFSVDICDFSINVNEKAINNKNEEYPLLLFRDITYFPLTWRFAVDEFGWEYNFTHETGLVINSDNYKPYQIEFPGRTGAVIFDGVFYYYMGGVGEDKYVYSVRADNLDDTYIIHQIPKNQMASMGASFINSHDGVYISYYSGSSPIMSSRATFRLYGGALNAESAYPDAYSYGNHGWFVTKVRNETISANEEHQFSGTSKITYTKDDKSVDAPALPEGVQLGAYRNGLYSNIDSESCIKIFEDKIYFTAFHYGAEVQSSDLYVIDTTTNELKKLLQGVCGFHVYKGYSNEHKADTVMILYDNNGTTMRYTEIDGKSQVVDNSKDTEGLVLKNAVGDYQIYAIYQACDGSKTVVKTFDDYASGYGSLNSKIFESKTGVQSKICDGKLVVVVLGESADDNIRLMVLGDGVDFRTSDTASTAHVRNNFLTYTLYDGTCLRVDLK